MLISPPRILAGSAAPAELRFCGLRYCDLNTVDRMNHGAAYRATCDEVLDALESVASAIPGERGREGIRALARFLRIFGQGVVHAYVVSTEAPL